MTKRLPVLATLALVVCLVLAGCRGFTETEAAWRTNFMGVWEYTGGKVRGTEINEQQIEKMKQYGMDCFIVLNERGTCRMNIYGTPLGNGTWDALSPTKAELVFVKVEEEDEEKSKKESKKEAEPAADESDKPQETRSFKLSYLSKSKQLLLKVDDNNTLRFSPTTLAGMNEYLDSIASQTPRHDDGFEALDEVLGKSKSKAKKK